MSIQTATFTCPSCSAEGDPSSIKYPGEIVACPSCSEELEVESLEPLRVVVAPEPEEDWGE